MLPTEDHAPLSSHRGKGASSSKKSATETWGEIFVDGSIVDVVKSVSGWFRLISWNGTRSSISYEVDKDRKKFIPPKCLDRNLLQCMKFPTDACPYGSTKQLAKDLQRWFAQHPGLPEDSVSIFVNFVLATHFPECIEMFPCFFVLAPDASSADLLLRLLQGVCRRSIRVTEITGEGIFALPFAMRPTVLIDQVRITNLLQRTLRAMSRPGVSVLRNGQFQDIFCPLVICSGHPISEDILSNVVHVVLMPTPGGLPRIDGRSLTVARELRAKLLRYRFENFRNVQESKFEATGFSSPMVEIARTLGCCVVDHKELQQRLVELLRPHEEVRVRNSTSTLSIVIEAALALCHEKNREVAYVGEFTALTNTILRGRLENIQLESREVGDLLRSVGLRSERLGSAGRGLRLFNAIRLRIHRLARAYEVLSLQARIDRCEFCTESRIALVTK